MTPETIETFRQISGKLETRGTTGGDYALSWQDGDESSLLSVKLWTCPITLCGALEIQDTTLVKILESKGHTVTRP